VFSFGFHKLRNSRNTPCLRKICKQGSAHCGYHYNALISTIYYNRRMHENCGVEGALVSFCTKCLKLSTSSWSVLCIHIWYILHLFSPNEQKNSIVCKKCEIFSQN